jgi:hypothetical protein
LFLHSLPLLASLVTSSKCHGVALVTLTLLLLIARRTLRPSSTSAMDPTDDLDLPPAPRGGSARSHRSSSGLSSHLRCGASPPRHQPNADLEDPSRDASPPQRPQADNHVMLCVSPSAGLATFGYVYLADAERRHEDALTAYFDSAGREVTVLPCPNFERFVVVDYNIPLCDVLFVSDLPRYIILVGIRILASQQYANSPRFDWLPDPPSLSSFGPSSRSTDTPHASSSQRSPSLLSRHTPTTRSRPDPDGVESYPDPRAPVRHVNMGGPRSVPGGSYGGGPP